MLKQEQDYGPYCFECKGRKKYKNTITCIKCSPTRRTRVEFPICPHCEHKHLDWFDFDDGIHHCDDCEKPFKLETETVTYFSTESLPQNQSLAPNCPSCNSDLVQEEGHEFGDPDGEETGIIDHFHCTDCGQDFLKDGTKLVKHSETSLVAKEEK